MKIQEILENYNVYKAKISIAEGEIQELRNEMYDLQAVKLDGMPKRKGFTVSSLEETVVKAQDKIDNKERYINELKNKLKIVDDLVKTLKKYNQEIIEMRFYQKMSINEISRIKDKEYRTIQSTIDKSIEEMQREYNKSKIS